MSSDLAIQVENVSKCYPIYDKPKDRLLQGIFHGKKQYFREFWALHDVSLEVKKGESVGIIGRNGSGKSTLLQIITGTLSPTSGTVRTDGRIGALLELGSGFNPEFTGRENVHLNGALLGLSREQIDEKFDLIASFAGIGKHMDQPVKTYSSGMLVRLAFAVQVQIEPDILIIDEALAVGDAVFQHKCARRLHELRERKVTLIFVSHDPGAVATFCDRGLLLDGGKSIAMGTAKEIIELYLARVKQELYVNGEVENKKKIGNALFADFIPGILGAGNSSISLESAFGRIGTAEARLQQISIYDEDGIAQINTICSGERFRLRTRIKANENIDHLTLCYRIDTLRGVQITGSTSNYDNFPFPLLTNGEYLDIDIELALPLKPDTYSLGLYLNRTPPGLPPVVLDGLETAAHIAITKGKEAPPSYLFDIFHRWQCVCADSDPAGRKAWQLEDKSWNICVRDSTFTVPDHWFWTQYADNWENDTFRVFQQYLHSGSKFADIGAWVGATAMFAAALGSNSIHAVEANPESAKFLNQLVKKNPILSEMLTVYNLCISEQPGIAEFGNADGSQATSSASSLRGKGFYVNTVRLYDFLRENMLLDASLIKIDIEGAETLIGPDLELLSKGFAPIFLSLHPPFWGEGKSMLPLYNAIALFQIKDSSGHLLSREEIERRCASVEKKPSWGTPFGNFFEILLLPKCIAD